MSEETGSNNLVSWIMAGGLTVTGASGIGNFAQIHDLSQLNAAMLEGAESRGAVESKLDELSAFDVLVKEDLYKRVSTDEFILIIKQVDNMGTKIEHVIDMMQKHTHSTDEIIGYER